MAERALIFDLDGTVWDSAQWFAAAIGAKCSVRPEPLERSLRASGNIVAMLNKHGLRRESFLGWAFENVGTPSLYPQLPSILSELHGRGERLGIVTNLPGSIALPMISECGLEEQFATIVHAGRCRVSKPNPRGILMALDDLRVHGDNRSFYIGDRLVDAEAARRANISFLWAEHGYEVPPQGSEIQLQDVADLLAQ